MPNSPQSGQPSIQTHQLRQAAESFGTDAERYDRTRPRYPAALIERIVSASPGPDVLDVGCGTGIVARQFAAADCRVLGVEPDARMAEFATQTGVQVEVATFEEWDQAGRDFDAVVAGQAWHWVDPAAGAAKAAQVLRPRGRLALFWHVFQLPDQVVAAIGAAMRRVDPDSPFRLDAGTNLVAGYLTMCARAADALRDTGGFGEAEQWRYDWERPYTKDECLDLIPTTGALTRLPPDKLAVVLDSARAALDAMGGSFTMSYVTVAVSAPYRVGSAEG
jgi:SAM-dependent methyltransferase